MKKVIFKKIYSGFEEINDLIEDAREGTLYPGLDGEFQGNLTVTVEYSPPVNLRFQKGDKIKFKGFKNASPFEGEVILADEKSVYVNSITKKGFYVNRNGCGLTFNQRGEISPGYERLGTLLEKVCPDCKDIKAAYKSSYQHQGKRKVRPRCKTCRRFL